MLRYTVVTHVLAAALLAAAAPGARAQIPLDCFNDEEETTPPASAANDLEPPAPPRIPPVLQVTDGDVAALLEAIAAHERRRQAGGQAPVPAGRATPGGS